MSRQKLARFQQNWESPNVIETGKPLFTRIRGRWHADYFGNEHPLVLELACGKGEYTVGLASAYSAKNFVGIDIKGDRIARGSQAALAQGLTNAAFLRTDIRYLREFFEPQEVAEIWITFPDPQPRPKQEKHRLTSPYFLALYAELLKPDGLLHLKTDNEAFFAYSLTTLPAHGFSLLIQTTDLYQSPYNTLHLGIKTKYEALFFAKGFSINYLQAQRTTT